MSPNVQWRSGEGTSVDYTVGEYRTAVNYLRTFFPLGLPAEDLCTNIGIPYFETEKRRALVRGVVASGRAVETTNFPGGVFVIKLVPKLDITNRVELMNYLRDPAREGQPLRIVDIEYQWSGARPVIYDLFQEGEVAWQPVNGAEAIVARPRQPPPTSLPNLWPDRTSAV